MTTLQVGDRVRVIAGPAPVGTIGTVLEGPYRGGEFYIREEGTYLPHFSHPHQVVHLGRAAVDETPISLGWVIGSDGKWKEAVR